MSFWSKSTGESAAENVKQEYSVGGGDMDPIPDGSSVLAFIEEVKWDKGREEDGSPEYLKLTWRVEKPEGVARRVVFHKLWLTDPDPYAKNAAGKRDKALDMLATIDANSGGKLAQIDGKPSDDKLMLALANKMMVITLGVWEIGGGSGNWVRTVSPKNAELKLKDAPQKDTSGGAAPGGKDYDDEEIPF